MASPLKGASKLYLGGDNTYGQIGDGTLVYKSSPVLVGTSYWSTVAEGTSHVVAIRSDGALFAWGRNETGQLGTGHAEYRKYVSSPVQIGTSSWVAVAASNSNSYAIRKDGGLFAWGDNFYGQIGNNSTVTSLSGFSTSSWSFVDVTTSYIGAITSDQKLFLWGFSTLNNILNNSFVNDPVQTRNTGIEYNNILTLYDNNNYRQITTDPSSTSRVTFVKSDYSLWTRGINTFGQLGDGTTINKSSPIQIGTNSWILIRANSFNTYAIRSDGALFTWGANYAGQLGQNIFPGGESNRSSPVQVGTSSWIQVTPNTDGTLVAGIRTDGALFMWGTDARQNSTPAGLFGNNFTANPLGSISWTQIVGGQNGYIDNNNKLYVLGLAGDGSSGGYWPALVENTWTKGVNKNSTYYAIRTDGALFAWGIIGEVLGVPTGGPGASSRVLLQVNNSSWAQVDYISSGQFNPVLAIRNDGALFAWGRNDNGVLGDGTTISRYANDLIQIGSSSWSQISCGENHVGAIRTDGALFVWGSNAFGQIGDSTTINKSSPVQIGTSSWSQINCGSTRTFAIRNDGGLFSWGRNNDGTLGSGTTLNRSSPVQVGTSSWSQVQSSIFYSATAAIRSDGRLFTWGAGTTGVLADGTTISKSSPVQIGTSSWTQVRLDPSPSALRIDNTIWAWRVVAPWDYTGAPGQVFTASSPVQIGTATKTFFSPIQVGTSSWSQVTFNFDSVAAIRSDGALFTWGNGANGTLGSGATTSRSSPVQVGTSSWSQLPYNQLNSTASHAIRTDGALFGWGTGISIGDNTTINRSSPVQIGTSSWSFISSNNNRVFAIRSGGSLFLWGISVYAGNGSSTTVNLSSPVQIGAQIGAVVGPPVSLSPVQIGTSSWTAVTAGKYYASAIRTDGGLFAWGLNNTYQLGDNTTINRSSPVQIGTSSWILVNAGDRAALGITTNRSLFGWGNNENFATGVTDFVSPVSVGAGFNSTAIVSRNGKLYAWGGNSTGTIGDGTTINKSRPVQIGTSSWSQVHNGGNHTVAINSIGQLYAWGQNTSGQLGDNTSINRSSPVLISTSSWSQVEAGYSHTMALRIDGALFAWGSNSNAQLGLNINSFSVNYSSPVQVGTSSWIQIGTNSVTTHAIRSDGALFGWGDNSFGQIGNNAVNLDGTLSWTQVANGFASATQFRTFGIRSDGALLAWGAGNNYGELGIGALGFRSSPVQLGTSSWSQVAAGQFHALAIRVDGALFAWGRNDNGGGLGDNTILSKSSPVQIGTSSWSKVGAGADHSVAIRSDGALFAWGYNVYGAAGDNSTLNRSSPVQLGSSSWTAVAAGNNNAAAIRSDGRLFTWGKGDYGVLGESVYPYVNRSSPVQVGTSSWTQVGQGTAHTIAIRSDGGLFAWGSNLYGELGQNSINITNAAQSWSTVGTYSNTWHGADIRTDGALFIFGPNLDGQLGINSTINTYSPVQVGTSSWTQVVCAQGASTYAIRSDGALFAWGLNDFGALGDNTTVKKSSPVQIGTSSWIQLAAGMAIAAPGQIYGYAYTPIAIRKDGALFAWGRNDLYQIGDGTTINRSSPVLIGGSTSFTQVTYGLGIAVNTPAGRSYAIRSDGSLFTWGAYGDTGPGNGTFFAGDNISWTQISAGTNHVAAIDSNSKLYTWGINANGQLGDSTTVTKSSPVQIGTSNWSQVVASDRYTLAMRSDGALFTWGLNNFGQLGAGTTVSRSSPVQVGTSSWTQISSRFDSSIAIRIGGSLFTWGYNNVGQLGDNTTINKSSPVQIGTSSWTQVAIGTSITGAIRSDGGLFTWGYNNFGSIGDNTIINRSSPVQIGTSSWTQVSMLSYTAAIRSDGRLFTWGPNIAFSGILGDGTFQPRSSPVQVGTSSWSQVRAGRNSFAIRSDGALFGWGLNQTSNIDPGGLGINNISYNDYRQSWTQIKGGGSNGFGTGQILALRNDGGLFFLGNSSSGSGGIPEFANFSGILYPIQIGTSSWTQLDACPNNSAAIRSDGALFTWGSNSSGQLGDSTTVNKSSPVQIGTSSWIQVALTSSTFNNTYAAIRSDGALFTWGSGSSGALGSNATVSRSSPVQVGTSSWIQVAGYRTGNSLPAFSAIRSDGALFTWGVNQDGQLGDGTTVIKSSPVQIGTSSWTIVSGNAAIRSDGRLFTWGANSSGQLGDGTTVSKSSPVQIGTSSWTFISTMGSLANFAIRVDGALFGWGRNSISSSIIYNVGNASRYDTSSPVQIGIGSSWSFVHNYPLFGFSSIIEQVGIIAIRSDKTLYGWGPGASQTLWNATVPLVSAGGPYPYNAGIQFQPGNLPNTPTAIGYYPFYASPVQIGTDSWTLITTGGNTTTYGIRNSKIYHWGYNGYDGGPAFPVGDGTTAPRSSPVQIGLDKVYRTPTQITNISWSQVHAGGLANLGVSTDNKLYTWRSGSSGELGSSNTSEVVLSPRDLHARSWKWVGNTRDITQGAIRNDGALFTWGNGINGPLGNNTQTSTSSPIQIGTSSWVMVTYGGARDAAAIRDFDYQVFGWGYNFAGQVGDNTTISRSSPVIIGVLKAENITKAGLSTFVIEKWSNALVAWGSNSTGLLGDNTTISRSSPVYIGTSKWQNVNAYYATYAIREDGALFAWGSPDGLYTSAGLYATGNNVELTRSSPVQIGTSSWTQVSTNLYSTLAIRSDGALFGWGMFNSGQLGTNESWNDRKDYTKSWAQVAFGFSHAVGVRSDGLLFTWGYDINGFGVLGDNRISSKYYSPLQIGTSSWTKVGAGEYQSFAIRTDGALFTWGNNGSGALGDNTVINRSSPVQIGTSSWTQVDGPAGTTVAIRTDGGLFTWGSGTNGALGSNATTARSSPVQVGTSSWTQIRGGNTTVFAIRNGGSLFAWGYNQLGWLGDSTTINKSSPVQIGTSSWTFISTRHAIRSDGALFAWGSNSLGQLGDGTTVDKSSPVQIGTSSWTQVRSGNTSYGIRSDGALFAWGSGANYNIGDNTTVSKSSPVQIGSSSWSQLGTSYRDNSNEITGTAIRTDGGLFTWGREAGGATLGDLNYIQLGIARSVFGNNIDTGYNSSPVQVGLISCYFSPVQIGTSSWSQVLAGPSAGAAIRIDGALFTWGSNYGPSGNETGGQLGQNSTVNTSSPIQVGTSSWTQVQGLNDYGGFASVQVYARRSDGTLWSWGAGNNVLGLTTTISRSSPVQIGNNGPWSTASKAASLGYNNAAAIRTDGALFTWGNGGRGALGDNTTVSRSSAVQIGTSSWTQVITGVNSTQILRSDNLIYWAGGNVVDGSTNSSNVGFLQPTFSLISRSSPVLLGSLSSTSSPVQIGTSSWTQIATGALFNHNRAIRSGGSLFAWGRNNSPAGVIGDSTTTDKSSPVQIGTSSWIQVSSAHEIRLNYVLFGQGENAQGATGDGTVVTKSSPVQLGSYAVVKSPTQIGTSSWSQVYAGATHTVALRSNGSLFTWGGNSGGQLGDNTTINKSSPIQIGSSSWYMLAAGSGNTYGITSANLLFGWGSNFLGVLGLAGDGTALARSSPVQLGANPWREIYGKGNTPFAIRNDGAMFAWGINELNSAGSIGDGTTTSRNSPVLTGSLITSPVLVDGNSWNFASAGYDNGLGVDINNRAYAWGYNRTNTYSWTQVQYTNTYGTGLAIRSDGALFAWGSGQNGILGDGTTVFKSSPVQIGTSSWSQVIATGDCGFAIRSDGALFGWGSGFQGNLGDNTTTNKSSPVQIGTSSWISLCSGGPSGTMHAIRLGGSLFGWGTNNLFSAVFYGAIGDNTTINRSSPVQIGTSSWIQVAGTYQQIGAIRSDGALFTWGSAPGGLGDGVVLRSSPVQIGTSSWTQLSVGAGSSSIGNYFVIRSDGALFGWGNNADGQLGDGTTINKIFPVQIGTSSWTQVLVNRNITSAIRSDGALFQWGGGFGSSGSVFLPFFGNGSTIPTSSPVQIGTSSWTQLYYSNFIAKRFDGKIFMIGPGPYPYSDQLFFTTANTQSNNMDLSFTYLKRLTELPNITSYPSPTQIGIGGTWKKVSAGASQNYLINNANVLYNWGTRLPVQNIVEYDYTPTAVTADIDDAGANKNQGGVVAYIKK
jgi:alpha-tubulin suppressor-like RCC1 family protein